MPDNKNGTQSMLKSLFICIAAAPICAASSAPGVKWLRQDKQDP